MNATKSLVSEIATSCRTLGLFVPGERVLVAVSGGADSTALAWILAHLGEHGLPLDLVLGHVDHGWRGPEAAAVDADLVRALAARLQAPWALSGPPPTPVTSEDAARRWRYHALRRMAEAHGARKIATGHHLQDQAETVLMRLERTSGRVGLRGIPRRRPLGPRGEIEVVRPLLDTDPKDLRRLLEGAHVPWVEDPTNRELTRDRARVRRRFDDLGPRSAAASRRLAEFAQRMDVRLARREAALEERLASVLQHVSWAGAVCAPRRLLAALSASDLDLALRRLGREVGADGAGPFFTRHHLGRFRHLLRHGGCLDLPRGARLQITGASVWLRIQAPLSGFPMPRLERRDFDAGDFDLPAFLAADHANRAAFDADRLGLEPRLRKLRDDDRFVPWSRHETRLMEGTAFLAKQGVPKWLRREQLVLDTRGDVAWMVGYRVDRRYALTPTTKRVAVLQVTS